MDDKIIRRIAEILAEAILGKKLAG